MSEDSFYTGRPVAPATEKPYNASNPSDITVTQEMDKYRRDRALEDLTVVLNSPTGRAVLWRIFGLFHLTAVSATLEFPELAAMHALHREGLRLKGFIEEVDPAAYHRLAIEAFEKERAVELSFKAKREAAARPSQQS